jgi:hypothetical protein
MEWPYNLPFCWRSKGIHTKKLVVGAEQMWQGSCMASKLFPAMWRKCLGQLQTGLVVMYTLLSRLGSHPNCLTLYKPKYMARINYGSVLQNLMRDASSVTKLFIPPSDRRLRRTTLSKLPSEHVLNHHKFQDAPTTLGWWGSCFPPTLVYAFPMRWQ